MEWSLDGIITAIGEALKTAVTGIGEDLANSIFDALLTWLYETVFGAMADFFELIGNMGAEIFDFMEKLIKDNNFNFYRRMAEIYNA